MKDHLAVLSWTCNDSPIRLRAARYRPLRAPSRRHEGFSLYEALVTLAVSGVLAAVGVPSVQRIMAANQIATTVNTLVSALHLARSEAIKRRQLVVVCPSADGVRCDAGSGGDTRWEQGLMTFVDHNGSGDRDGDEPVLRAHGGHADGRLSVRSSRFRSRVTYRPSGYASGTNATFVLCDRHQQAPARFVILNNTGRPRVAHSAASDIGCD